MGLLKGVFTVLGVLVLALVGIAAYLYFTDYAAQATITGKGTDSSGNPYVVVTPKLLPGVHVQKTIPSNVADFVCVGYQVQFHVNTQAYRVFDKSGALVYDSATGQSNLGAAARCAASNGGGGVLG